MGAPPRPPSDLSLLLLVHWEGHRWTTHNGLPYSDLFLQQTLFLSLRFKFLTGASQGVLRWLSFIIHINPKGTTARVIFMDTNMMSTFTSQPWIGLVFFICHIVSPLLLNHFHKISVLDHNKSKGESLLIFPDYFFAKRSYRYRCRQPYVLLMDGTIDRSVRDLAHRTPSIFPLLNCSYWEEVRFDTEPPTPAFYHCSKIIVALICPIYCY